MKNRHITDNLFRDAAKRYREKPPQEAWAAIDSTLNRGRRKKAFILIATAAAVMILLIGFGAGYLYRSVSEKSMKYVGLLDEQSVNKTETQDLFFGMDERSEMINDDFSEEKIEVSDKTVIASAIIDNYESEESTSELSVFDDESDDLVESSFDDFNGDSGIVEAAADFPAAENPVEITQAEKDMQLTQMLTQMPEVSDKNTPSSFGDTYSYDDLPVNPDIYEQEWSVGGDIAAAYAYRTMPAADMEYRDRSPIAVENGVASWNAGVYATKELSGIINIKTGVTWSSYGQGSQNLYAYQDGPSYSVNSSSGNVVTNITPLKDVTKFITGNNLVSDPRIMLGNTEFLSDYGLSDPDLRLVQRFDYIEVPFMIQLSSKKKKGLSVITEAGFFAGILTGNTAFLNTLDESYRIGHTENIRPFTLGGVAGAGAKYHISKSLSAQIMPELRYSFLSISKMPNIEYHPYQFGLAIGMTYHF